MTYCSNLILGLKSTGQKAEGDDLDFSEVIKTSVTSHAEKLLGKDNVKNISIIWTSANRMYQASANIFNKIRSITDSTKDIIETSAEEIGIIGNALRKHGVVPENSYNQMPEKVGIVNRFLAKLNDIDDAADFLEDVTSNTKDIAEDWKELNKKDTEEFEKALTETFKLQDKLNKVDQNAVNKIPDPKEEDEKKFIEIVADNDN